MKSDQNNKPEFFTKFCQAKYDSAPKKNVIIARVQLQLQVFHNITAEALVQSELWSTACIEVVSCANTRLPAWVYDVETDRFS